MRKKAKTTKENVKIREDREKVQQQVKDYLTRSTSFQEVGTEQLPDKHYDVLHFPHIIYSAGVIMSVYGYFIIFISTQLGFWNIDNYLDGLIILIIGCAVATLGLMKLLQKYLLSFIYLLVLGVLLIIGMLALWDYVLLPYARSIGIFSIEAATDPFWNRAALIILTTLTFSYTACLIWFIGARYTSLLYLKLFASGKERKYRFFVVDPWRKILKSKFALMKDVLGHIYYPFLFLLTLLLTLQVEVFFIDYDWNSYFGQVLLLYFLLCAMVVLFPAFWLLDYLRYYNKDSLEVNSLGGRIVRFIYGYAGLGSIVTFITRSQAGVFRAILEFYMVTMYLIPSLIVLIGSYILLTERDVYFIAGKVPHGDKVIIDYKLIDADGKILATHDLLKGGEE